MIRALCLALALAITELANGFSLRCVAGTTTCISTQGTTIPSSAVVEMLDYCDDFTRDDVGRIALKLSQQQILERSNGKASHPLVGAMYAFEKLYDSPLRFERKSRMEDTSYAGVKKACLQLMRDFNDDAKWSN